MGRRARAAFALAIGLSAMGLGSAAEARDFRVNEIPNGATRGCDNCHSTNPVVFNAFGSHVRSYLVGNGTPQQQSVDWASLAALDSDGDGFTNGEELGDPNGTWRPGDPNPSTRPSHPGDPDSAPTGTCGDGRLGTAETCEGDALRGETCESQGFASGTLRCSADCRLDTSDCSGRGASSGADDGGAGEDGGCAFAHSSAPAGSAGFALLAACFALTIARRKRG